MLAKITPVSASGSSNRIRGANARPDLHPLVQRIGVVWDNNHPLVLGHCYDCCREGSAVQGIDVLSGFYQGGSNEGGHVIEVSISLVLRLRSAKDEVRSAGSLGWVENGRLAKPSYQTTVFPFLLS